MTRVANISMPYTWLVLGIGYRKSKVNGVPDSWKYLFDSNQYAGKHRPAFGERRPDPSGRQVQGPQRQQHPATTCSRKSRRC
jgi:hypothetical protein